MVYLRASLYLILVLYSVSGQMFSRFLQSFDPMVSMEDTLDPNKKDTSGQIGGVELSSALEIEGRTLSKKPKIKDRFILSCTEFKQVILEGPSMKLKLDFEETCFSISKLPHCRLGCREETNVKVKYRFACFNTETDKEVERKVNDLKEKVKNGTFVDLARQPLRKLKVRFPSGCKLPVAY